MTTGTKMKTECIHGKQLWWNFGDGKPRHMSTEFNRPTMHICEASYLNKENMRAE